MIVMRPSSAPPGRIPDGRCPPGLRLTSFGFTPGYQRVPLRGEPQFPSNLFLSTLTRLSGSR